MELEDLKFTEKEADRILAEAAEREARDEEKLSYSQLVEIAEEATIDPKYLKASKKQLVRETGGLERVAMARMVEKTKNFGKGFLKVNTDFLKGFLGGYFIASSSLREDRKKSGIEGVGIVLAGGIFPTSTVALVFSENTSSYAVALAALSILTQAGSGIYEWYRHEKNKLVEEVQKT